MINLLLKILFGVALLFLPPVINGHSPEAEELALDLDGDGRVQPLTDGLLVIRYLFGFEGDALSKNALGEGAERTSGEAIVNYVENNREALDFDLDGKVEPLTDGLILIRYLFGFSKYVAHKCNLINAKVAETESSDEEDYNASSKVKT